ncbi:hypothetical protein WICPIJ_004555 [Wickerhamomyces pijperi]|uniref:RRM domain-containing protein n=1 Tax=Wickerhamomyces pijperi TaxID=599730 RepID=A0A9P8Q5L5_WICPI|nr:hypothetical protein WICPIJ_004555 [Wickerhamomyces pijperi]
MKNQDSAMDIDIEPTTIPVSNEGIPIEKSIQGYVLIISNVHEETTEEDLTDFLEEFGKVKDIHLNLDRQTGYAKGYAFAEFETLEEAQRAKSQGDGEDLLGHILSIDFAFVKGEVLTPLGNERERSRSRSPERYKD